MLDWHSLRGFCARGGFSAATLFSALPVACSEGSANDAEAQASNGDGDGGETSAGGASGSDAGASGASGEGPGPVELEFEISLDRDRRSISPFIYGGMDEESIQTLGATLARLSGNEMTSYNWEVNATNLGVHGGHGNAAMGEQGEAGSAARTMLELAEQNGGMAYLTVPLARYVAADAEKTNVLDSPNYLADRFRQNQAVKGSPFEYPPDTSDEFVYQDEFVDWVMSEAGQTPVVFSLGNQPSLWNQDHSATHPVKASYADVVELNLEFSRAIKDVWPDVKVAGPVLYGWQAFLNLQNSPDFASEGEFIDYYLTAMEAASSAEGRRLLDVLDVRWWTAARSEGVRVNSDDEGPEIVTARLQAPRSLWDEQYVEESWITNSLRGKAIALIPRLRQKIEDHYPGTELGISAWMFGGRRHISGAIAAADALGIFGREGIAFAAVELAPDSPYVVAAYQAYLNYDGEGGRFLDTSVRATTSDRFGSSVYASISSEDESELVVIALNKRNLTRNVTVSIDGEVAYRTSAVYELTDDSESIVLAEEELSADDDGVFSYDMPPLSLVVLVPRQ